LDGDGIPDLLSGSWPGELYFFKGEGKGKFATGQKIKDKNGKIINLGSASTAFACDWRGTGALDLLVGDIQGHVWLVPNEGTKDKAAYGKAVKLQAGGKDIMVNHGDSHPVMADWEATGKPGLIVGCGDGGVLWFRNVGTRQEPKLDSPMTLVPGTNLNAPQQADGKGPPQHGSRAKVCVVDWNGDGKLDLLVGDFSSGTGPAPKLTEKQQQEKKELQAKQAKVTKELQPYFQELSKVYQQLSPIKDNEEKEKKLKEALAPLTQRFQKQLDEERELFEALQKYQAPYFMHGYVWVYLRKDNGKAAVAP
jgi:hypothetical protein